MHYYNGKWQSNFCPFKYKSDLVEWAMKTFPAESISKFKRMKVGQLRAIWYNYKPKGKD